MSIRLRDLIKAVRACKTAAEEREVRAAKLVETQCKIAQLVTLLVSYNSQILIKHGLLCCLPSFCKGHR